MNAGKEKTKSKSGKNIDPLKYKDIEPTEKSQIISLRSKNMLKFNSWVNDYNSMQKQEVKPTRYYKI